MAAGTAGTVAFTTSGPGYQLRLMGLLLILRVSNALTNDCVVLTSASLPTERTEVYASRNTLSALLTISSPLTVMSVASPSPRPTRYSMARRSGQMGYALRIRTETAKYCTGLASWSFVPTEGLRHRPLGGGHVTRTLT